MDAQCNEYKEEDVYASVEVKQQLILDNHLRAE
jgi:hypothetical protein